MEGMCCNKIKLFYNLISISEYNIFRDFLKLNLGS